jgi:hypothetical protein
MEWCGQYSNYLKRIYKKMLEDIYLDNTWIDIYDISEKAVGTELLLQNKTGGLVYVWTGASAPETGTSGFVMQSLQTFKVKANSLGCFVKGVGALFVE